jgi:hypothetical protein
MERRPWWAAFRFAAAVCPDRRNGATVIAGRRFGDQTRLATAAKFDKLAASRIATGQDKMNARTAP